MDLKRSTKLIRISMNRLQNEVHFRFHVENERLYRGHEVNILNIAEYMPAYQQALADEDLILERIRKSSETVHITEADERFDETYRYLRMHAQSYLGHANAEIRRAAENIDVVFHQYGSISKQPYRKELGLSNNLIQELRKREDDIKKLSLESWIAEHEKAMEALEIVLDERAEERSKKTKLKTMEVRATVDAIHQIITDRLDAMINIKGDKFSPEFVVRYNEHATEYKNALAMHLGQIRKSGEDDYPVNYEDEDM